MITLASALQKSENAWYCVRTQHRHEVLAEYSLIHVMGIECFLPRIRYRKARQEIVEPLFPGYVFAKFDLRHSLRKIHYCQGVSTVVHFGHQWPTIPEATLQLIRQLIGAEGVKDLKEPYQSGDAIEVLDGPFRGFGAIVTRVVPAKERICVLLDFLGRQTVVQLDMTNVRLAEGLSMRTRQACFAAPA